MLSAYDITRIGGKIINHNLSSQPSLYLDSLSCKSETISQLKFIGMIQSGEKINVKHMIIQQECWQTKISRSFFYCDSRKNAYNFIVKIIKRAFEIVQIELSQKDYNSANSILSDIQNAMNGINNLRITYQNDIKISCDFDTLIQDINKKVTENVEIIERANLSSVLE